MRDTIGKFLVLFLLLAWWSDTALKSESLLVKHVALADEKQVPVRIACRLLKSKIFVGERLEYEAELMFDGRRAEIKGIALPACRTHDEVFATESPRDPRRDSLDIDGRPWTRLVWRGVFYPKGEGVFQPTSFGIEYISLEKRRERMNVGFFGVFGFDQHELKSLEAEAPRVFVEKFPAGTEKIAGVGQYRDCQLVVDQTSIACGEAVQCSLLCKGIGSAGFFGMPTLQLPEGCVIYPSDIQRVADGAVFRFVVQCNNEGYCTIPEQKIYFFDPEKKQVYACKTGSIPLHVLPHVANKLPEEKGQDGSSRDACEDEDNNDSVRTLTDDECSISLIRRIEIPADLFLGLLFLLVSMRVVFAGRIVFLQFIKERYARIKRQREIRRLLYMMNSPAVEWNQIYLFFSGELTSNVVKELGWKTFWELLQEVCFSPSVSHELDERLRELCRQWLQRARKMH